MLFAALFLGGIPLLMGGAVLYCTPVRAFIVLGAWNIGSGVAERRASEASRECRERDRRVTMTLLKRLFGLLALLTGAGLLVAGLGQKLLAPGQPFKVGPMIGGLVWGALCFHFGRKWLFNWTDLGVLGVDPRHPELLRATERARGTLDVLWRHLAEHRHECFIKFPMETKGSKEHIWAVVHSREGDAVVVSLANEPVEAAAEEGARRVVPIEDIEDWQVVVSPTEIRGGYSIAAMEAIARERGYSISPRDRRTLDAFVDVKAARAEPGGPPAHE